MKVQQNQFNNYFLIVCKTMRSTDYFFYLFLKQLLFYLFSFFFYYFFLSFFTLFFFNFFFIKFFFVIFHFHFPTSSRKPDSISTDLDPLDRTDRHAPRLLHVRAHLQQHLRHLPPPSNPYYVMHHVIQTPNFWFSIILDTQVGLLSR